KGRAGLIVVDLDRRAPGRAVVVGEAHEDVRGIGRGVGGIGVDEVGAAVVRAATPVVDRVRLRVDAAVRVALGRDDPAVADVAVRRHFLPGKAARTQAVRVQVRGD